MERRWPVMLLGTAGTGKSVLVGAKLASLDGEQYQVKNVPFNYYTTSAMLQGKGHAGEPVTLSLTLCWSRVPGTCWVGLAPEATPLLPLCCPWAAPASLLQHPLAPCPFLSFPYIPPWPVQAPPGLKFNTQQAVQHLEDKESGKPLRDFGRLVGLCQWRHL